MLFLLLYLDKYIARVGLESYPHSRSRSMHLLKSHRTENQSSPWNQHLWKHHFHLCQCDEVQGRWYQYGGESGSTAAPGLERTWTCRSLAPPQGTHAHCCWRNRRRNPLFHHLSGEVCLCGQVLERRIRGVVWRLVLARQGRTGHHCAPVCSSQPDDGEGLQNQQTNYYCTWFITTRDAFGRLMPLF